MMDLLIEKIQMKLERAVQDFNGMMGVYAQDTSNPENKVFVNEKIIFPTASSIKIAILIEFFRKAEQGIVDLLEPLTLNDEHIAAGSGVLLLPPRVGLNPRLLSQSSILIIRRINSAESSSRMVTITS